MESFPNRQFKIIGEGDYNEFLGSATNVQHIPSLHSLSKLDLFKNASALLSANFDVCSFDTNVVEAQLHGIFIYFLFIFIYFLFIFYLFLFIFLFLLVFLLVFLFIFYLFLFIFLFLFLILFFKIF